MSSPKILVFSTNDTIGGAGRAAYRINNPIRKLGVDSKMIVLNKTSNDSSIIEFLRVYQSNNFLIRQINNLILKVKNKYQKSKWNKYPNKENVYMSDMGLFNPSKLLETFDHDIVHLHWISDGYIDFRKLNSIDKPIVWTLHDCFPFTGGCHYFYTCDKYKNECGNCPFLKSHFESDLTRNIWKKKQKVYSKLKIHVVSPSNWLAECARQSSLFKNCTVTVIPNCIDTNIYQPLEKNFARSLFTLNQDTIFLLVGAMNLLYDSNKGYHFLKGTLDFLNKKSGLKIEILVLGSDQKKEDYLYGFKAYFLGQLQDDLSLACLYNSADVTLVTSLSENLSYTIMESLSCGTPVVAFNVGGNSELIEDRQNGYLVDTFEPEQISEGILWCIENNKHQKLSINARQKVLSTYSLEVISNKYIRLYNDVFNNK